MKHQLPTPCPVITLWQPHAAMMLPYGLKPPKKRHETRSWPAPGKLIGKPVAIHAAARIPDVLAPALEMEVVEVFGARWRVGASYGAVLGVGILAECYPADWCRAQDVHDLTLGSWGNSRWAWRFEEVVTLLAPVYCAGSQRIWYLPDPVRTLVESFL